MRRMIEIEDIIVAGLITGLAIGIDNQERRASQLSVRLNACRTIQSTMTKRLALWIVTHK